MSISFTAEVIEVKAKKLASMDRSYRVVLETPEEVLKLAKFINPDNWESNWIDMTKAI